VDRLSSAIVAFTRFFSLPLDPALVAKIRRQALTPQPGGQGAVHRVSGEALSLAAPGGQAASPRVSGEALSLAAAAAADKGLELSPEGLERYASALDPAALSPADPDRREDQRKKRRRGAGGQSPDRQVEPKPAAGSPAALKERLLEAEGQNPLLGLLNRLPGRKGQRWLALPLSFTDGGRDYRICLRVLLREDAAGKSGNAAADRLALDIVSTPAGSAVSGQSPRWLFIMDAAGGKNPRLRLILSPARPERVVNTISRGLPAALNIPPNRLVIQNGTESTPFALDSRDDLLRSINEAV
jgi:hypothetical protein